MTRHLFSLLLLAQSAVGFSQSAPAETVVVAPAAVMPDSLKSALNISLTLDSLTHRIVTLADSLPVYNKIDSIRSEFNAKADSIQNQYQKVVADIHARVNKVRAKIDSISRVDVQSNKYLRKCEKSLNKLSEFGEKAEGEFTGKFNALKAATTEKLSALELPPEYMKPLKDLTQQIDKLNLNSQAIKIPSLKIPGYDMPDLNGLSGLPSIKGISAGKIPELPSVKGVSGIDALKMPGVQVPGELGALSEKVTGYGNELEEVAGSAPTSAEQLQETIESRASRIDGMDELGKQSGIIDEHKARLVELTDPAKPKEKAAELAKRTAVDHFAGKEEQLKAAMEKISKYKQKYSSVSSIKHLPKRPPNPMKGKPFIERLTPGIYFQYQRKNHYLLDVNPYAGYKLSGRFAMGLGWNHRLAWDSKYDRWDKRSSIFGPRAFVDFKLGKGFIAHVEGETMNSFVPSTLLGNPEAGHREWVWSCMTGLKKEYKIYKNLKGTALIQYNLFNRYYKAPYVDRLNSRIGFEYVLKKKSAKQ